LGFSDQALRTAEESIGEARATGHANSLCLALALAACPLALWVGNLSAAARYAQMLLDHAREQNFPLWSEYGFQFQRVLLIKEGGHDETTEPNFRIRSLTALAELAGAFALAGRIGEGLAAVEAGIELSDESCATPELLRLKGELLLLQSGSSTAATAEDLFRQALPFMMRQAGRPRSAALNGLCLRKVNQR
jgi:hypothetical protein